MTRPRLGGSLTALVTPFRDGKLDEEAFRAHVEWQIESGTKGLVPVGTTGESPTLSHAEHNRVVEICVHQARGRVPVVAGAGSNNTAEAIELARHAEAAGADAILVVTPYYNKPIEDGLRAHYAEASEAAGETPVCLYNIPPRSVVDMSVATMARLFQLKNVVGVKDATANLARVSLQRQAMGPEFLQFSGEDMTALAFNAAGGHGCISVVANVAPHLCAELQDRSLSGDYAGALAVQDRLVPLHDAVFLEPGLAGAKCGLSLLGRCTEEIRLPLLPVSEGTRGAIRGAMIHAGLLNA